MSLLQRFLGLESRERDEPESVRRIAVELEGLGEDRARFVAAFAFVLARIAHADLQVDAEEVTEIRRILTELGSLEDEEARLVSQIALEAADELGGTDNYLVTRAFREMATRTQRGRLLRCLYAVAAADDEITTPESTEIAAIGEELGFRRTEINGIRMEFRDKLAELRKLPQEEG